MKEKHGHTPTSDGRPFLRSASAVFRRNPVLTAGLLIAPVVAAAINLKAGVALSIAAAVMVLPSVLISKFLQKLIPDWVLAIISVLLSSGLAFLAYDLVKPISPLIFDTLGIYFPLMIITPLSILGPGHDHLASKDLFWCVFEVIFIGVGFSLVACLTGALRELIANASIWGVPLGRAHSLSFPNTVFAGFIILGFTAALFRSFIIVEKAIGKRVRLRAEEKRQRRLALEQADAETSPLTDEEDA